MEYGILPLLRQVCKVRFDILNARQTSAESIQPSRGLDWYNSFNADTSEVNLIIWVFSISHADKSIHTISILFILCRY